jgi:glycosyltransferase involved in cell wall biosynthesis
MRAGRVALPANVTVRSVGKERGWSEPRRAVEFYRALVALLPRRRYDAAFAHMAPLFAAMAGPLLRARRIPLTLWYARAGAAPPLLRLAAWWADSIVTPSRDSFPLAGDRVVVTGHGIDTTRFAPAPEAGPPAGFHVVSVGRIAPIKRLEVLVDAVRLVRDERRVAALRVSLVGPVLDGDRAYAERLRRRIDEAGLADVVALAGPVRRAEIPDHYRAAGVAVNLSDTDSVDKAVIEAMACAVPTVSANRAVAPILEAVHPRLVVPKGDAPALADRLAWLAATDPAERAALGARLRAVAVRDHSLDRLVDLLVTEVLGRPRRAPRPVPPAAREA